MSVQSKKDRIPISERPGPSSEAAQDVKGGVAGQMSPYAAVFYPMGSYASHLLALEQAAQINMESQGPTDSMAPPNRDFWRDIEQLAINQTQTQLVPMSNELRANTEPQALPTGQKYFQKQLLSEPQGQEKTVNREAEQNVNPLAQPQPQVSSQAQSLDLIPWGPSKPQAPLAITQPEFRPAQHQENWMNSKQYPALEKGSTLSHEHDQLTRELPNNELPASTAATEYDWWSEIEQKLAAWSATLNAGQQVSNQSPSGTKNEQKTVKEDAPHSKAKLLPTTDWWSEKEKTNASIVLQVPSEPQYPMGSQVKPQPKASLCEWLQPTALRQDDRPMQQEYPPVQQLNRPAQPAQQEYHAAQHDNRPEQQEFHPVQPVQQIYYPVQPVRNEHRQALEVYHPVQPDYHQAQQVYQSVQPVRHEHRQVQQEYRPVQHDYRPEQQEYRPAQPVQQEYHPEQQKYRSVQIVQHENRPVQPVKHEYHPVQQEYRPEQQEYRPEQQKYYPVQYDQRPIQHEHSPVEPVQQKYQPVQQQYNSVQQEYRSEQQEQRPIQPVPQGYRSVHSVQPGKWVPYSYGSLTEVCPTEDAREVPVSVEKDQITDTAATAQATLLPGPSQSSSPSLDYPSFEEFVKQVSDCSLSSSEYIATLRNLLIRAHNLMLPLLRGQFANMTQVQMAAYTTAILEVTPLHPSLFLPSNVPQPWTKRNGQYPPCHPHSLTPQDLAHTNARPMPVDMGTQTEYNCWCMYMSMNPPPQPPMMVQVPQVQPPQVGQPTRFQGNPPAHFAAPNGPRMMAPCGTAPLSFWGRPMVPMHAYPHAHPHQIPRPQGSRYGYRINTYSVPYRFGAVGTSRSRYMGNMQQGVPMQTAGQHSDGTDSVNADKGSNRSCPEESKEMKESKPEPSEPSVVHVSPPSNQPEQKNDQLLGNPINQGEPLCLGNHSKAEDLNDKETDPKDNELSVYPLPITSAIDTNSTARVYVKQLNNIFLQPTGPVMPSMPSIPVKPMMQIVYYPGGRYSMGSPNMINDMNKNENYTGNASLAQLMPNNNTNINMLPNSIPDGNLSANRTANEVPATVDLPESELNLNLPQINTDKDEKVTEQETNINDSNSKE